MLRTLDMRRVSLADAIPGKSCLHERSPMHLGVEHEICLLFLYSLELQHAAPRALKQIHDQLDDKRVASYTKDFTYSRISVTPEGLTDRLLYRDRTITVLIEYVITSVFAALYRKPLLEQHSLIEFRLSYKGCHSAKHRIFRYIFISSAENLRYH